MYRSFTIKNFRCFHDLTLASLERVNLIAGKNNVGKTALLEAVFLHLGVNNPSLPLQVTAAVRGIEQRVIDASETLGWLFFDRRVKETIELIGLEADNTTRRLSVRFVKSEIAQVSPVTDTLTTVAALRDLQLEYQDTNGQRATTRVRADGATVTTRAGEVSLPLGIYLSTRARSFKEDAERFSNLERVGRHAMVLPALQLLEPRLRRLAVLITGGAPILNGDIGIAELIPLPLMGEGMVRLLSILLAIANAPGGVVLVDEIENGLHHSVMVGVWKALAEAARQYNTQVFATTHSWECIQAAHQAFEASGTYDFRLHRLDRVNDDIQAVAYDRETLATSAEMNLEIR